MNGVLDASVALGWIFTRIDGNEAALAERALSDLPSDSWIVPAIWHAEIGNGLLGGERAGVIPPSQSAFFLDRLYSAHIETDPAPQQVHLAAVLALARMYGLTGYDATYLDLALRTGRTLATFDRQLADAVRKAGGQVFGDAV